MGAVVYNNSRVQGRGLVWLLVVVAVVVIGYVLWFFANYQHVELGVRYTPKAHIVQDRYFAAKALLGQDKAQSQTYANVKELFDVPPTNQTVVLYQVSASWRTDFDKMLAWVQSGGHLVVASQAVLDFGQDVDDTAYRTNQNPLLLHLGIVHTKNNPNHTSSLAGLSGSVVPARLSDGRTFFVSTWQERFVVDEFLQKYPTARLYDYEWFVKKGERYEYATPLNTGLTGEQQQKLLQIVNDPNTPQNPFATSLAFVDMAFGKGRLTVLNDAQMFTNPKAGMLIAPSDKPPEESRAWQLLTDSQPVPKHNYTGNLLVADNAYFLMHLTTGRQVYFVSDVEQKPFLQLLMHNIPWTMMGICLTVLVGLFALPKRFGVVRAYETDTSRNIFGFFAHVGQYLWASDQAYGLLTANRQALINTIIAKENITTPTKEILMDTLTKKTGLPAHVIDMALYETWTTQSQFLAISRSFARLAWFYH